MDDSHLPMVFRWGWNGWIIIHSRLTYLPVVWLRLSADPDTRLEDHQGQFRMIHTRTMRSATYE